MTSPQKAKGNSWERTIAIYLSELYESSFHRIPNSGAYVGGKNSIRKESLDTNQIKSFKGDIAAPDTWTNFNSECKSYADFPFHQVLAGSCKQLDTWLDQLMSVAEDGDLNILFVKINRKGKFVAVQSKYTWVTDQFMYYTSKNQGDWVIVDFGHFFKHNRDLLKAYSGTTSNNTNIENINITPNNINLDTTS
jgi:hypothetical protein